MNQLVATSLPKAEGSPALAQALALVTSPEFLTASAEKQWDGLVGFWVGETLEIGEAYAAEGAVPHPLLPSASMRMTAEYSAKGRVPCHAGATTAACVELRLASEVDPDDLKKVARTLAEGSSDETERQKLEAFEFTVIKEETLLIAEPETLLPHRFVVRKTIEGSKGPATSDRDGRIDYQETTFRYP
jgi:hypothetical protein